MSNADKIAVLPCMKTHYDGAHWGLSDWYPEIEHGIAEALASDKKQWTTGWYSSKKEIASARVTFQDGVLTVEATCSDDFDTEGFGSTTSSVMPTLDELRTMVDEALDEAVESRRSNSPVELWSIQKRIRKTNPAMWKWVETYLVNVGYDDDSGPPGNSYGHWGWQGEARIPKAIKDKLERAILKGKTEYRCEGYKIRRCDE